jgi:hypothetical protein
VEKNMALPEVQQVFDKSTELSNRTMLTVTEVPKCEDELLKLLERAMVGGFLNHAPLTEIHLPMEKFPHIESKFWHVPVEDCGESQVLRFFFAKTDSKRH